jgi:hypothetical protein
MLQHLLISSSHEDILNSLIYLKKDLFLILSNSDLDSGILVHSKSSNSLLDRLRLSTTNSLLIDVNQVYFIFLIYLFLINNH